MISDVIWKLISGDVNVESSKLNDDLKEKPVDAIRTGDLNGVSYKIFKVTNSNEGRLRVRFIQKK